MNEAIFFPIHFHYPNEGEILRNNMKSVRNMNPLFNTVMQKIWVRYLSCFAKIWVMIHNHETLRMLSITAAVVTAQKNGFCRGRFPKITLFQKFGGV